MHRVAALRHQQHDRKASAAERDARDVVVKKKPPTNKQVLVLRTDSVHVLEHALYLTHRLRRLQLSLHQRVGRLHAMDRLLFLDHAFPCKQYWEKRHGDRVVHCSAASCTSVQPVHAHTPQANNQKHKTAFCCVCFCSLVQPRKRLLLHFLPTHEQPTNPQVQGGMVGSGADQICKATLQANLETRRRLCVRDVRNAHDAWDSHDAWDALDAHDVRDAHDALDARDAHDALDARDA